MFPILFILLILLIIIFLLFDFYRKENIKNIEETDEHYEIIKFFNPDTYEIIKDDLDEFNKIIEIVKYDSSLFYYYYDTLNLIVKDIEELIESLMLNIPQNPEIVEKINEIKIFFRKNLYDKIDELKKEYYKKPTIVNILNKSLTESLN